MSRNCSFRCGAALCRWMRFRPKALLSCSRPNNMNGRCRMRTLAIALLAVLALAPLASRAEEYTLGPDSKRQPGVPQGKVTKFEWTSKIYPGTVRDYWVYVPAQYQPDKPACTMVFQDG